MFLIKRNFLTAEEVEGKRKNSKLIWIVEEQFLYSKKDVRADGTKVLLCYQNKIDSSQPCPARRLFDLKGVVTTNGLPHARHENHRSVYDDMKTRSNIISGCIQAATALEGLNLPVPNQDIFTRELSK